MILIAEVGNGKILGYSDVSDQSGDVAPSIENNLTATSSIYLYDN
ncbi:hypothetical protein [Pareuzebyella sediminis]|nr:hypothetical protein [Pareuzebyella sediminis]